MRSDDLEIPPHNVQAEMSVLWGEMLCPDHSIIQTCREIVDVEDFHVPAHGLIQTAILAIADRNEGVDQLMVRKELEATGRLSNIGGDEYLRQIMVEGESHGYQVPEHAKIIAELSAKRQMLWAFKDAVRDGYNPAETAEEMFDRLNSRIRKLGERLAKKSSGRQTMHQHMLNVVTEIEEGRKPTQYVGIGPVDEMTRGTARGENVVIGALTSMGKTMVAMQWGHETAGHGIAVLIISNEMAGNTLASRLMSKASLMPSDMWSSNPSKLRQDIDKFYANRAPIIVAEGCSTISEVERVIDREVAENNIGLVILDYCQLVKGEGSSREQQVGDVSRRFKQCLLRNRITGLLLSQLNRSSAKEVRPPVLSDLRDSGSIEQDADIVLFPWWEAKVSTTAGARDYKVFQAKNRARGIETQCVELTINPLEQWLYPKDPADFTDTESNW